MQTLALVIVVVAFVLFWTKKSSMGLGGSSSGAGNCPFNRIVRGGEHRWTKCTKCGGGKCEACRHNDGWIICPHYENGLHR